MRKSILTFAFVFASSAFGLTEVGDKPKNYCWKDTNEAQVCLEDAAHRDSVRVLLYNAGWCGPCNTEFSTIASATNKFKGKPVVFISLSSDGWSRGAGASTGFLKEWSTRHRLNSAQASFVVASSPRNAGNDFFSSVYIPNVVVIDSSGVVSYKEINPGVNAIVREVERVLPTPVPSMP